MTDREELPRHNAITLAELRHIHRISAKVVGLYGDVYLPLFVRLTKELEKMEQAMDARSLALKVATDYDGLGGERKRHTF